MKLVRRKYHSDEDYWRIRQFLREIYLINGRHEYSWPLYRWDYWRWHVNENIFQFNLEAAIFLWESGDGQIVALLNPDGPGEAFLNVHPNQISPELEVEMMSLAETHFAVTQADGSQRLCIWSPEEYAMRRNILKRRGYICEETTEAQRRRSMSEPIESAPLADGYTLRALGDESELPARSWLSWKAFHPDEPDDRYQGWEWYRNVQRAPLYRRDLDLVVVAPDGELAAFGTIWFDDIARTASFEPVGTHPAHQRRGLGKALLTEGLRRAARLGATLATVNSYSKAAGALYASVGFTGFDTNEAWVKEW